MLARKFRFGTCVCNMCKKSAFGSQTEYLDNKELRSPITNIMFVTVVCQYLLTQQIEEASLEEGCVILYANVPFRGGRGKKEENGQGQNGN